MNRTNVHDVISCARLHGPFIGTRGHDSSACATALGSRCSVGLASLAVVLGTNAEDLIGQSGMMSRREQLQQQLTATLQVRHDLRREQDRAQRITTRVLAPKRVDRRGVSLVVLRLVAEIAGLQPTAVLVSRRLLKRSAPGADGVDAEAAALQALLDAPRCVAGATRVRLAGATNKTWCKAVRLAAEVQVLRILLEANCRGAA